MIAPRGVPEPELPPELLLFVAAELAFVAEEDADADIGVDDAVDESLSEASVDAEVDPVASDVGGVVVDLSVAEEPVLSSKLKGVANNSKVRVLL